MRIVDPQNFFFFFSIHDLDLLGRKYKLLISIKLGNQWNIVFYIYKLGKGDDIYLSPHGVSKISNF